MRDQENDSEEIVWPLMQDGTYLSRNFATLGSYHFTAAIWKGSDFMSGGHIPSKEQGNQYLVF